MVGLGGAEAVGLGAGWVGDAIGVADRVGLGGGGDGGTVGGVGGGAMVAGAPVAATSVDGGSATRLKARGRRRCAAPRNGRGACEHPYDELAAVYHRSIHPSAFQVQGSFVRYMPGIPPRLWGDLQGSMSRPGTTVAAPGSSHWRWA